MRVHIQVNSKTHASRIEAYRSPPRHICARASSLAIWGTESLHSHDGGPVQMLLVAWHGVRGQMIALRHLGSRPTRAKSSGTSVCAAPPEEMHTSRDVQ